MVATPQSKDTILLSGLKNKFHLSIAYKRLISPSKIEVSFKQKGGNNYSKQLDPGNMQLSLTLYLGAGETLNWNKSKEINKETLFQPKWQLTKKMSQS